MESPARSGSRRDLPGETVPKAKYDALKAQHDATSRRLESTRKELESCLIQLGKARIKLRDSKEIIKGWQQYVDRHPKYVDGPNDFRVRISGVAASTHISSSNVPTSDRQERTSDPDPLPEALPVGEPERPSVVAEIVQPPDNIGSPLTTKPHRNASSQTTQDDRESCDEDGQGTNSRLDDPDDDPVFLSTRTVKRSRPVVLPAADAVPFKRGEGTPQAPFKIKEEESETTIGYHQPPCRLGRTQTSDLDTLLGEIETPRKRRKFQDLNDKMLRHYQETGSLQTAADQQDHIVQLGREFTPENEIPCEDHVSPQHSEAEESPVLPAPRTLPWESRTRIKSPVRLQPRAERKSSGPLQPISTNTPTLPRTSTYSPKPRSARRSDGSRGAKAVHLISEDKNASQETHNERPQRIDRLENLLEGHQSPERELKLTPQAPSTVRRLRKPKGSESNSSTPQGPLTARRVNTRTASPTHSAHAASTTKRQLVSPTRSEIDPDHEPLRARPLHRLNLSDFKINPAFAGTTYAYTSPSRTKVSRACLPGCTRPCCSTLRAFMPSTKPSTSTTLNETDDELLRTHLGHSYHQVAPTLSLQQKLNMVTEAKAQQFANKYGRHRQVFERRTTPPGFWNGDMETSQEREVHREEAKVQIREEVERRWRSALGDGGRYKFRDE